MCKIVILTDASKVKRFNEFAKYMCESLSDQKDGFGYAAIGKKGVFGTRTLYPSLYPKVRKQIEFAEPIFQDFGQKEEVSGPAMFHGRISTNSVNMLNTHPIERDGWTLIHNGVVTHHGEKYDQLTTNDSEHVLYNLISGGIDKIAQNLTGYYACGVFDPHGYLHVFKCRTANLYVAWSDHLQSFVFATTIELISKVADYIKEQLICQRMKDDTYLLFNGNELAVNKQFKSRGYDSYSSFWSQHSIGRQVEWNDDVPTAPVNNTTSLVNDDMLEIWNFIEDEFLDEMQYLDDTYTYYYEGKSINFKEFEQLAPEKQFLCEIYRNDRSKVKILKETYKSA